MPKGKEGPSIKKPDTYEALRDKGMSVDLGNIKPENLEELVDQLCDLTVDVDDKDAKVRVFCE